MRRVAAILLAWLCAALSASAQAPGQAGTAQATIQLPVVNQIGAATTIMVPTGGSAVLGGASSFSANRDRFLGGVGPIGRAAAANGIDAGAVVHDFSALEEQTAYRIAKRKLAEREIAEAIDRFVELGARASRPRYKALAVKELASLKRRGLALYARAQQLAEAGRKQEAAELTDRVLGEYGRLLLTTERRKEQQSLHRSPEVAEARHGAKAQAWLEKGRAAERRAQVEVAKVYYRLAARQEGTEAAADARDALANEPSKVRPSAVKAQSNADRSRMTARQWLALARLYRKLDPGLARDYYREAIAALPADSALLAQAESEAKLLSGPDAREAPER